MKKLLALAILTALPAVAGQIKLHIVSTNDLFVTFWTRTAETNWYVYTSPSLLGPWTEVHHATQPPQSPQTWAFTYYRCFGTNCRPRQYFYADTEQRPPTAPPPPPGELIQAIGPLP